MTGGVTMDCPTVTSVAVSVVNLVCLRLQKLPPLSCLIHTTIQCTITTTWPASKIENSANKPSLAMTIENTPYWMVRDCVSSFAKGLGIKDITVGYKDIKKSNVNKSQFKIFWNAVWKDTNIEGSLRWRQKKRTKKMNICFFNLSQRRKSKSFFG